MAPVSCTASPSLWMTVFCHSVYRMPFFQDFLIHALMVHLGRDEFDATVQVLMVIPLNTTGCSKVLRITSGKIEYRTDSLMFVWRIQLVSVYASLDLL
jgi:hypothetical protein